MNGQKPASNRKRRILKISMIVCIAFSAWLALWFLIPTIENCFLRYVDDLDGYALSSIQGNVEEVGDDEYLQKKSPICAHKTIYCLMFPEHIPAEGAPFFFFSETVKSYRDFSDRFEIYLCCEWGDEKYAAERERLKDLGLSERDDLFPLPSFVYRYDYGHFLYALFDQSNNAIHYIYLSEVGSIENVVFDRSLAPTKAWFHW